LGKILVVDDEPDIAESVKKGLEADGFKVDAFTNPRDALKNFVPAAYDTAILDIRMPGMNGFQLYKELLKRDGEIRVLFFSAFEDYREEFRAAFPELDTGSYLKKPSSLTVIKERIRREAEPRSVRVS
jgi:DNA-binding response OmpR family regulator